MIAALALALALAASQDDPADAAPTNAPAPSLEPAAPAAPALAPADPAADVAPARAADPLAPCKLLLGAPQENTGVGLAAAERCFRQHAAAKHSDTHAARALAMADVIAAWRLPASTPTDKPQLFVTGRAEALLHGAAGGTAGGFLLAGAIASTMRASEQSTLPWLLASPALGAVVGTTSAWLLLDAGAPNPGDVALITSAMWTGAAEGFLLQLSVFDGSREASSIPLQFVTVLGGGLVGLAGGALLAPLVDVTTGDAAVAHSALLWGGVMTGFGFAAVCVQGCAIDNSQRTLAVVAGSALPYLAALVLHPLIDIERWPSWLIEAGGAAGFLTGAAALTVFASSGVDPRLAISIVGATTLMGVGLGSAGAWTLSNSMKENTTIALPVISLSPTLLPELASLSSGGAMPGLVMVGMF